MAAEAHISVVATTFSGTRGARLIEMLKQLLDRRRAAKEPRVKNHPYCLIPVPIITLPRNIPGRRPVYILFLASDSSV